MISYYRISMLFLLSLISGCGTSGLLIFADGRYSIQSPSLYYHNASFPDNVSNNFEKIILISKKKTKLEYQLSKKYGPVNKEASEEFLDAINNGKNRFDVYLRCDICSRNQILSNAKQLKVNGEDSSNILIFEFTPDVGTLDSRSGIVSIVFQIDGITYDTVEYPIQVVRSNQFIIEDGRERQNQTLPMANPFANLEDIVEEGHQDQSKFGPDFIFELLPNSKHSENLYLKILPTTRRPEIYSVFERNIADQGPKGYLTKFEDDKDLIAKSMEIYKRLSCLTIPVNDPRRIGLQQQLGHACKTYRSRSRVFSNIGRELFNLLFNDPNLRSFIEDLRREAVGREEAPPVRILLRTPDHIPIQLVCFRCQPLEGEENFESLPNESVDLYLRSILNDYMGFVFNLVATSREEKVNRRDLFTENDISLFAGYGGLDQEECGSFDASDNVAREAATVFSAIRNSFGQIGHEVRGPFTCRDDLINTLKENIHDIGSLWFYAHGSAVPPRDILNLHDGYETRIVLRGDVTLFEGSDFVNRSSFSFLQGHFGGLSRAPIVALLACETGATTAAFAAVDTSLATEF